MAKGECVEDADCSVLGRMMQLEMSTKGLENQAISREGNAKEGRSPLSRVEALWVRTRAAGLVWTENMKNMDD